MREPRKLTEQEIEERAQMLFLAETGTTEEFDEILNKDGREFFSELLAFLSKGNFREGIANVQAYLAKKLH